jgi:hypothetical protein
LSAVPTAVVRVVVDADGSLTPDEFASGLSSLRDQGFEVLSAPIDRLAERRREVELIVEGPVASDYVDICAKAFGTVARLGVITYISRGTDEDAEGVLSRFGLAGLVERSDENVVTVTLPVTERRAVPESRLLTALEAALNCEVRLRFG